MLRSTLSSAVRARSLASMCEPLPGVPLHELGRTVALTYQAEMDTLENGVRVVSLPRKHPLVSVCAGVQAGSRYERAGTGGAGFFLANTFLKSSRLVSSLRLTRMMEWCSDRTVGEVTRELVCTHGTVQRNAAPMYGLALAETLYPALKHWEMNDARPVIDQAANDMLTNEQMCEDLLHAAAFNNQGPGRPLIPFRQAGDVSQEALEVHVADMYTADRAVFASVGIPHKEALEIAQLGLGGLPDARVPPPAVTPYKGGVRTLELSNGSSPIGTYFSIAHSAKGVSSAALDVLEALLGEHHPKFGSWRHVGTAGRLGKLDGADIHTGEVIRSGAGDEALLGVRAWAFTPSHAHSAIRNVRAVLKSLTAGIDSSELHGAQRRAARKVLSRFATADVARFLAECAVRDPTQLDAAAQVTAINALTAAEVQAAAKTILATPESFAALGDLEGALE